VAKDGRRLAAPPLTPSEDTRHQPKSAIGNAADKPTPIMTGVILPLPVPPPITLKLPSFVTHLGEGTREAPRTAPTPTAAREQTLDLRPVPALELKIRAQDQPAPEQPVASPSTAAATPAPKPVEADQQQAKPELPPAATSVPQPRAEEIVHAVPAAPGPIAIEPAAAQPVPMSAAVIPPAPVNPPQVIHTQASSAPTPPPQAPAAHLADEPLSRQPEQPTQPLRSLSLEFAPDGAQDVRVRLAERGGDVHISLHSTDPALSGRLSDGVHELVGTLASAGYDAQAWTQGQGRQNHSEQNQAPPDDPRRNRRNNSDDSGTEDFDTLMRQPIRINP
jgi:hypothetical protein